MDSIIKPVTENDIVAVQKIATLAWPAAYNSFLDPQFVKYELAREYSTESLLVAIKTGESFFLYFDLPTNLEPQGFFSLSYLTNEQGIGKLNKFYLNPQFKFQGLGKKMLKKAEEVALNFKKVNTLRLLVNRKNPAVEFYKKNGFEITGILNTPTSEENPNFVREDYWMQKKIQS